ncbi:MAG: hypothetical protein WBE72_14815, partial [Terracidiphilus sp.]
MTVFPATNKSRNSSVLDVPQALLVVPLALFVVPLMLVVAIAASRAQTVSHAALAPAPAPLG